LVMPDPLLTATGTEGWIRALEPAELLKPREDDMAAALDNDVLALSQALWSCEEEEESSSSSSSSNSVHIRSTCLERAPETSTPTELLLRSLFSWRDLRTAELIMLTAQCDRKAAGAMGCGSFFRASRQRLRCCFCLGYYFASLAHISFRGHPLSFGKYGRTTNGAAICATRHEPVV